jgi:hypothetical protein
VDLLKGRSFIISSTYKAIFNVIVDYITPYVVLAINLIEEKVTIKKYTRLIIIYKYKPDTIYFIIIAKNTFKVLTIATTLGISYTLNITD